MYKIETQYGKAERIWVIDRGIFIEAVLAQMRDADPPSPIWSEPQRDGCRTGEALLDEPWQAVRESVDVKVLPQEQETYVLAQAAPHPEGTRHRQRKLKWRWARLKQIANMKLTRQELLMKLGAAAPRLARREAHRYRDRPQRHCVELQLIREKLAKYAAARGAVCCAPALDDRGPTDLQFYIQLTEVEAAFKT